MNENTHHAIAVEKMLEKSKHFEYDDDPQTALIDLLTDVMHLADVLKFPFEHLLEAADRHHRMDVEEHGVATRRKQDWTPRKGG